MSNPPDQRRTTSPVEAVPELPVERRRQLLFLVLAGFFLTNALVAEFIGGKLLEIKTGLAILGQSNYGIGLSCGLILWPVVFICTDIVNEYFGRKGVRRLSFLGAAMIAYAFIALWIANSVPTADFSPIKADAFSNVVMQSQFIIVGSIMAFLLAQLVDVTVFWIIRRQTGHKWLWLRATGSTVISQIIDTYVVGIVGLYLPFALHQMYPERFPNTGLPLTTVLEIQTAGYFFKVLVAVGITPVLYVVHAIIDRYLGRDLAETMIETTAKREGAEP